MIKNSAFFIIFLAIALWAFLHEPVRNFSVLSVNDVYNIDAMEDGKIGGFARLKTLRDELTLKDPDLITLHAGDFLSPSTLGMIYKGKQMIDIMNQIDGTSNGDADAFDERFFVVPGNHEFDETGDEGAKWLRERISESDFTWVSSNILWNTGTHPDIIDGLDQIVSSKIIEAGGVKVGIFGLTLERDETNYAPIDGNYVTIARNMTKSLRDNGAEVVIALNHLFMSDDTDVLNSLGEEGPDIIFGGHEHVAQVKDINGRYIVIADSDLGSATIANFTLGSGGLNVSLDNKALNQTVAEDTVMKGKINAWLDRYNAAECGAKPGEGCVDTAFGHTSVELIVAESDNRVYETNTGNWLADVMLDGFKENGAQIAFINSGAIRKNENIPAGSAITKTLLEELLPYNPKLYLIDISGAELKAILTHAVEGWPGQGHWLQISGVAFRQNTEDSTVSDIRLIEKDGSLRPIKDSERIKAVTVGYLLNSNGPQDGYRMLGQKQVITSDHNGLNLIKHVEQYLMELNGHTIAPKVEGRICNPSRPQYCLLDVS